MSDRTLVQIGRAIAVVSIGLALFGAIVVLAVTDSIGEVLWSGGGGFTLLFALFLSVFVWLTIPGQPRNGAVWAMVASSLGGAAYLGLHGVAVFFVRDPSLVIGDLPPSQLPVIVDLLSGLGTAGVYVGLFGWTTLGMLLFPDGRPPTPRWRWVGWLAGIGIAVMAMGALWERRPWSTVPATEDSLLVNAGGAATAVAVVICLASIVVRLRRSRGVARDQLKWVVWGAALFVPWLSLGFVFGGTAWEGLVLVPIHGAVAVMLTAYGIAVGKYRLFDIDVVISRTLVFGALAIVITGLYVLAVVGVSQLVFGAGSGTGQWSVIAVPSTAAAAVAFQPLRRRFQRAANRVVYGKRATPYEVLSQFSTRVAASDSTLLDQVTRSLVDGTAAIAAVLSVDVGGESVVAARWPSEGPAEGAGSESFPIRYDGVELGRLDLELAPGQRMSEQDRLLADEVSSGIGLALRNQRLTQALHARVEELRESRRRLVTVQDATRRKLERDLHDGAQQQLVALKVKLGLARSLAAKDGATETDAFLAGLAAEADEAVETLRDFARGVYPPLLEAEGLEAAVGAQARRAAVPTALTAENVRRYSTQIESTVYFCVAEALQNIAIHSQAGAARIRLEETDGVLRFEVSDDGRGFDPTSDAGTGLVNMRDRVEAVGGSIFVRSAPGDGTSVVGAIPIGGEPS